MRIFNGSLTGFDMVIVSSFFMCLRMSANLVGWFCAIYSSILDFVIPGLCSFPTPIFLL